MSHAVVVCWWWLCDLEKGLRCLKLWMFVSW
uniref:Uncharacterized protein n=1 Tax=Nelumbo nucifera TaxID=4432 RepID=A0A822XT51_NELNU|nr:TPA_asm: hypothetical protein HUJ06_023813 [Nelumbo nucifera]DAD22351.1 TPA_asm: hypothetical protein HUJ06_023814 [Nelumbo nucifera]